MEIVEPRKIEIVEPRKIYENLAVRICALNTDQVSESTDKLQTVILYINSEFSQSIISRLHIIIIIHIIR